MRLEFSDERLQELREMADGKRPFVEDKVLEELVMLDGHQARKLDPRTRLAVGYFAAASRRRDMLARQT